MNPPPRLLESEETSAEVVALASPGKRLRAAREAKNLEVTAVATYLHLSNEAIEALEDEDFTKLPARVFVRGYYRNYARFVDVPESLILREFASLCPDDECKANLQQSSPAISKPLNSSHGVVKAVTWMIVIASLGMLGYWAKEQYWKDMAAISLPSLPITTNGADPVQPGISSAQPEEQKLELPAEPQAETPSPAMPEPTATSEPAPTPQAQASASAPVSEPVAEAAKPTPAPQVAATDVEMVFKGECWVDVRDSSRKFKLFGTMKAGERKKLEGKPPYSIVLGNMDGVQILVGGQPIDLSPYASGGSTVKFSLDPSNLD